MKPLVACFVAASLLLQPAFAAELADEEEYFGSEVIADGNGSVDVKIVYFANEKCWQIKDTREGVPDKAADQPTERHLYVTVNLVKVGDDCSLTNEPLKTRLTIPDKKGKISLDIFFVDERGFLTRSQRHRIQRETCMEVC